jgi:GNAT superfamily N-acetyltransferase
MTAPVGVRTATAEDTEALTGVLARAFSNDPCLCWIFRDPETRIQRLEALFSNGLEKVFLPLGSCFTTDDLSGCALWTPPGRWKTPEAVVEEMAPQMAVDYTPDELGRLLTFFGTTEDHHPVDRPEHWYLGVLAADLDQQGRGIGSACMRPILERCDADEQPAYLESSNERNVPLYERNGFAVIDVLDLPEGPPLWLMWREPRQSTIVVG